MFLSKRRDKWRLTRNSSDRIPTRWRFVIAGLIGGGTGLLILIMWNPGGFTDEKPQAPHYFSNSTSRIQLFGGTTRIGPSGDEKAPIHCTIRACSTVICSSIPESLDPGQIASDFITRTFKAQCPSTITIEQLIFETCTFPDNMLKENWLNASSLPIDTLKFNGCGLRNIARGAFGARIFAGMETLEIATARIKTFDRRLFQELSNLKNLFINDNAIYEAEYDLLQPVADSLEILVLNNCLKNHRVLLNITNGSNLPNLKIMSIQRNTIVTITADMFKSIPNVVSLYLGKSEIKSCQVDSFKITRSLEQLYLENNLLTSLPDGIFASLLGKPDFRVSMIDNPWDCTCEFRWIQDMIANHPSALMEMPKCETPARNAGLYISEATFCDITNVTTVHASPTSPIPRTTEFDAPSNEEPEFLRFTCQDLASNEAQGVSRRRLFSADVEWKFPARFRDFYAKPLGDGTVLVNLNIRTSGVSLIWFKSSEKDIPGASVNCVRNMNEPFVLTNVERGSSYTLCLLEDLHEPPSPFNCLAIGTDSASWTETWLTNEDKIVVLSVTIALIVVVGIVSVVSSFLVMRRNPSLLRGSKRVVMVRKHGIEALVLPKGIDIPKSDIKGVSTRDDWTDIRSLRKIAEPAYLTPLEFRKRVDYSSPRIAGRKDSKISRVSSQYSGGSYVSGIEPTPIELANWRRHNERFKTCSACLEGEETEEPPPLPPHYTHHRVIPSLSLSIDTNPENDSRNSCIDRES